MLSQITPHNEVSFSIRSGSKMHVEVLISFRDDPNFGSVVEAIGTTRGESHCSTTGRLPAGPRRTTSPQSPLMWRLRNSVADCPLFANASRAPGVATTCPSGNFGSILAIISVPFRCVLDERRWFWCPFDLNGDEEMPKQTRSDNLCPIDPSNSLSTTNLRGTFRAVEGCNANCTSQWHESSSSWWASVCPRLGLRRIRLASTKQRPTEPYVSRSAEELGGWPLLA